MALRRNDAKGSMAPLYCKYGSRVPQGNSAQATVVEICVLDTSVGREGPGAAQGSPRGGIIWSQTRQSATVINVKMAIANRIANEESHSCVKPA